MFNKVLVQSSTCLTKSTFSWFSLLLLSKVCIIQSYYPTRFSKYLHCWPNGICNYSDEKFPKLADCAATVAINPNCFSPLYAVKHISDLPPKFHVMSFSENFIFSIVLMHVYNLLTAYFYLLQWFLLCFVDDYEVHKEKTNLSIYKTNIFYTSPWMKYDHNCPFLHKHLVSRDVTFYEFVK